MTNIPKSEHPRPDRYRESWLTLNGEWGFEIDNEKSGVAKEYHKRAELSSKIIVPFCPESILSGIGHTDFMNAVWYRKDITIPAEWKGKRIILHIDGSDYETTVFVNGRRVGTHKGGYASFAFDITPFLLPEGNYITVYAEDDVRSGKQCCGKQSVQLKSSGCRYTRTTGIWQSVWLEAVPVAHIVSYKAYPNINTPSVNLDVVVSEASLGAELSVKALYEGREVGSAKATVSALSASVNIPLSEKHLWEEGAGRLYDLEFTLEKDGACDFMHGYFGLREVAITKNGFFLNGKRVFMRFVLDQGYYPDGITTSPSDEALVFDIKSSMECGFNGARLHQKVFEPRFLYHADRLGYLVFEETGNWSLDHTNPENIYNFLPEWLEAVERDFSHPSIIGWCPFNETWDINGKCRDVRLVDTVYTVMKALDKTRPVIADSGSWPTSKSDVHDVHDYQQDPVLLEQYFSRIDEGIVEDQLYRKDPKRQRYIKGMPTFVSEYGGIKWVVGEDATAWGYGKSVVSEEEFLERLSGLSRVLRDNPHIIGFCYTQLTDVEQEQNGLLTYNRKFKFPKEKYYEAITGKPCGK